MSEEPNIIVALPVTFFGYKFFCPKCGARYYLDESGDLVHVDDRDPFIHGPGEYKLLCENSNCREELILKAIEII